MEWYEKVICRPAKSVAANSPNCESVLESQEEAITANSASKLEPGANGTSQKSQIFTFGATPEPHLQTSTGTDPSQFPAFGSLGLTGQDSSVDRTTKPEASITDAADNLINAMTKMMNNRGRKSSQNFDEGIDLDPDNTQLSQAQRQMLQKVLSAALERLSDNESVQDGEKQDWFQCDACPKRTRLRCEMK